MIPSPARVGPREGAFTLAPSTRIQAADVLRPLAEHARDMLRPASGLGLGITAAADTPRIALEPGGASHESYRLSVGSAEVRIAAPAPEGLFYGLQTLRQLLPAAIYRRAVVRDLEWTAPCVEIEDRAKDAKEPIAIGGHNSLADVYAYEPVPAALSGAEAVHVLGAQAQLWTEFMPDPRHVEHRTWPRLCAMAEVLWSPRETRDHADFMTRLRAHLERLHALDVNFRPLDPA